MERGPSERGLLWYSILNAFLPWKYHESVFGTMENRPNIWCRKRFLSGKEGKASTPTVIFQYSINSYLLQCYYVGGTEDAATYILNEITKPLGYFMSPEAICEKLKKKDRQICELQYGKFKWCLSNSVNLKCSSETEHSSLSCLVLIF